MPVLKQTGIIDHNFFHCISFASWTIYNPIDLVSFYRYVSCRIFSSTILQTFPKAGPLIAQMPWLKFYGSALSRCNLGFIIIFFEGGECFLYIYTNDKLHYAVMQISYSHILSRYLAHAQEGKSCQYNKKRSRAEGNQHSVHSRRFGWRSHKVVSELLERGRLQVLRGRGSFPQADHLYAHQCHDDKEVHADERQIPGVDELDVGGLRDALARLREEGGQDQQRRERHHDAVLEGTTVIQDL